MHKILSPPSQACWSTLFRFTATSGMLLLLASTLPAQEERDNQNLDLKPTHVEIESIKIELGNNGKIETMAMDRAGRLMLGVSSSDRGPARPGGGRPSRSRDDAADRDYAVALVDPVTRKVLNRVPMKDVTPKMIHGCDNGEVYVCGNHRIARFGQGGKRLGMIEFGSLFEGQYKGAHASGVTACDKYFFIALGHGFSLRATEDIVRLDRDLTNPKLVVETQFGCCSHIDLDVLDDVLLIAENSRHRVNRYTLDGKQLGTWGRRERSDIRGFAACCNPVNFDFGPGNELYTAESGVGRVKRYTADGKYLGLVGYVDTTKFDRGSRLASQSCYIPVEVSSTGDKVYIMDVRAHVIRVLSRQEAE